MRGQNLTNRLSVGDDCLDVAALPLLLGGRRDDAGGDVGRVEFGRGGRGRSTCGDSAQAGIDVHLRGM